MDKRSIILVVSLFILIIAGMFTFAYIKSKEVVEVPTPVVEEVETPYANVTRITAKHFYLDGTHTFVGELELPTPCDLLEANALVMESSPEQILLDFTVINNAEMCAQVMTTQRFMVEANASEAATISARFMGRVVELNLVPAAAGETPEEFELFIKG